jgi:aldehyde dehydrogenase (NAD+)
MAPTEIKIKATGRTIKVDTGLFINNEFVASVDSQETIAYVLLHMLAA